MGIMNALGDGLKGGFAGAAAGFGLGLITTGGFTSIPLALLGGFVGGTAGAVHGALRPDYMGVNNVYNPGLLGYNTMGNYGGYSMPSSLMGYGGYNSVWGTAAAAGLAGLATGA